MTTALILRCDGRREYIEETVHSTITHLGAFEHQIIIDDSGDADYGKWLDARFGGFNCVHHSERRGLSGCFKSACDVAIALGVDYVFSTEDDYAITSDLDLTAFIALLESQPHLAQVALKRTSYSPQEHAAGGIVEAYPHFYNERSAGGMTWLETDHLFVFSPSLIPRRVIECALANTDTFLEDNVTAALWANGYRSCYWGAMFDRPLCGHVGTTRSVGYRW